MKFHKTRIEKWDQSFKKYVNDLKKLKKVVIVGDMNVAHNEIDLKNPKINQKNSGFTIEERNNFTELLESGFTDIFRSNNPEKVQYTWWSARTGARQKGIGWRLDYCITDTKSKDDVVEFLTRDDIHGSDHCPIEILYKI